MFLLELLPIRIKKLRESLGLSQTDLSRMAGCTQAQISAYERGNAYPGLETLQNLAKAFGITVSELLNEREPKPTPPRPPTKEEMALWVLEAIGISPKRRAHIKLVLEGHET